MSGGTSAGPTDLPRPGADRLGDRIGPYRLLEVLGEGGFGVVYLAERREPHVQRVALKVIKPGMDSRAVIARFEQERQALAVMDHPNVARVFDGGLTPDGRPYFVMEHVKGEPITVFCDRHRLTIRQRLALFIPVCEAVQHAHSKGVIHRDLKPGNVLVGAASGGAGEGGVLTDGGATPGVPKIIDFGVAKAVAHTLTEKTIFTEHGQIVGTPEYMSPEQAEMGAVDIDTRTDVYALGVLLYELLTGVLPFEPGELRSKGYNEIQRIIREVEAPRPSTKLTAGGPDSARTAGSRRMRLDELARELRRELEWIPLRAIRKNREERYRTPLELADDVRNYLEGRALVAGPESVSYRVRKYVRRHRGPVVAASLLAVSLFAGIVGTSLAMAAAIRSGRIADGARARAVESARVAQGALRLSELGFYDDPDQARGELERLAEAAGAALRDDPRAEAIVRSAVGRGYLHLVLPAEALPELRRAMELRRGAGGGSPAAFATTLTMLAIAEWAMGDHAGARRSLEEVERTAPSLVSANNLAVWLSTRGTPDRALALLEPRIPAPGTDAFGGLSPGARQRVLRNYALLLFEVGRHYEAERFMRDRGVSLLEGTEEPTLARAADELVVPLRPTPPRKGPAMSDLMLQVGIKRDPLLLISEAQVTDLLRDYQRIFCVAVQDPSGVPRLEMRTDDMHKSLSDAVRAYRMDGPRDRLLPAEFRSWLAGHREHGEAGRILDDLRGLMDKIWRLPITPMERTVAAEECLTPSHPRGIENAGVFIAVLYGADLNPRVGLVKWPYVLAASCSQESAEAGVEWAESAAGRFADEGFRLSLLGAALYRLGRFQEAKNVCERAWEINQRWYRSGGRINLLFAGMSAARLGDADALREALDRVRQIATQSERRLFETDDPLPVLRWENVGLADETQSAMVFREARQLAGTAPLPAR